MSRPPPSDHPPTPLILTPVAVSHVPYRPLLAADLRTLVSGPNNSLAIYSINPPPTPPQDYAQDYENKQNDPLASPVTMSLPPTQTDQPSPSSSFKTPLNSVRPQKTLEKVILTQIQDNATCAKHIPDLDAFVYYSGDQVQVVSLVTLKKIKLITAPGHISCLASYSPRERQMEDALFGQKLSPDMDIELSLKLDQIDTYSLRNDDIGSGIQTPEKAPFLLPRFAFCVKRKLFVVTCNDGYHILHEFTIPHSSSEIEFLDGETLLAATGFGAYSILIAKTPVITPLLLPIQLAGFAALVLRTGPKFHLVRLCDGNLIVSSDTVAVRVSSKGDIVGKPIEWEKEPRNIVLLFPYLVTCTDTELKLHDLTSGKTLHTFTFPKSLLGVVSDLLNGLLFLHTSAKSWAFKLEPYVYQLNVLEKQGMLREAIHLTSFLLEDALPDKVSRMRQLQVKRATILFQKGLETSPKLLEDLMALFLSFLAPPQAVLSLFPSFIYEHSYLGSQSKLSSIKIEDLLGEDGSRPASRSSESTEANLPSPSAITRKKRIKLLKALQSLLPYLADTRRKIMRMLQFERECSAGGESSYTDLNLYWRNQILPLDVFGDLQELAVLVDTVLFRCYAMIAPALIGPLFRLPNFCDVKVVEHILRGKGPLGEHMYKELIDFYYGRCLHRQALELLKELSMGEEKRLLRSSSVNSEDKVSHDENLPILVSSSFRQLCASDFKGVDATVSYLKRLGPEESSLILEFAEWVLEKDKDAGVNIFMADLSESEMLDPECVVKFLEKEDVGIEGYIEHVLSMGVERPKLGTKYVEALLKSGTDSHDKLVRFFKENHEYEPHTCLRMVEDSPDNKYLCTFIYKRLQEHAKVFDLLADLKLYDEAEEYCEYIRNEEKESAQKWLHYYLKKLLEKGAVDPSLKLIVAHGLGMSVSYILEMMPLDISISKLLEILIGLMDRQMLLLVRSRMEVGLGKVELVRQQEALVTAQARHIVVDLGSRCGHCGKKLSGNVVLGVVHNEEVGGDELYHYGCIRDQPKTKKERKVISFGEGKANGVTA